MFCGITLCSVSQALGPGTFLIFPQVGVGQSCFSRMQTAAFTLCGKKYWQRWLFVQPILACLTETGVGHVYRCVACQQLTADKACTSLVLTASQPCQVVHRFEDIPVVIEHDHVHAMKKVQTSHVMAGHSKKVLSPPPW